jgi:lipoprotein-releasing system permease protein
MQIPYELTLGWRYTRAGRATRRNGFISFISGVSMLGIALGVAALIIVLSVMNGFQKEVLDRMLAVVSHIELYAPGGGAMPDVDQRMAEVKRNPEVLGAAPFIASQALLARGEDMKGVMVRGIVPSLEPQVTDLTNGAQGAAGARGIRHRAGSGAGAQYGRASGRQSDLGVSQRAGDTCRCCASSQADDRGGAV